MKNLQKKVAPIDCEEAVRRFNYFIDNYIKGKAKEELVHHIADCRHCFERIEFEQMLKAKISLLGKSNSANEKETKNIIKKILSKTYMS